MTLVSHWMHVDLFTVEQAAALWVGYDPAAISPVKSLRPSEFVAATQMITAGIRSGEITADFSTNAYAVIGDHSKSLISRADLEAFARKRALFPAFLFDTLAPLEGTGGLAIGRQPARLQTLATPSQSATPYSELSASPTPVPPASNRGGRPPEYDWNSFALEIIHRANQPDGLPERPAELVRDMLAWFQAESGKEPAESSVRERISKIYKYMADRRNLAY
ncbi:hypothetical protein ABMA32_07915 [Mesorhizobium sp. VNQ89]|uniref:hypothetical protein n=1 Tax=Mesorhizobium quangtriensis TaxID=3157709 RepID=UPI0032B7F060